MSASLPLPTAAVQAEPSARERDADGRYWDAAIASASFSELLQTKTRLVKPLLLTSFGFIVATMLLAGYARGFIAVKVVGAVNIGYLLIFAIYLLCWAVAVIYVRTANAQFDRQASAAIAALQARERVMKALTLAIFAVILTLTLYITYWAAKRTRTTSEFYAAGGALSARQNGFALAGDWMSAAAFLGFSGLIALYGMDGSLYAVAALAAFLVILLLIAEPMRNTGRYTLGDVIAYRMQTPQARLAAVVGTIIVNLAYMIPQMAGAGALMKLILGIPYETAVVLVGIGMMVYVLFGGMIATTWVQIIKAALLLGAATVLVLMLLAEVGFNPLTLFSSVELKYGEKMLLPGGYLKHPLDPLSLALSFMLGTAGLPHIMTRFFTVPDARTARKSVLWLMFLAGSFFLVTTLIGFAAASFVGQDAIKAADKGGNLALPLLAQYLGGGAGTLGGQIFLAAICAVAFATILAVVAGLTLATSGAIAHDLYVNVIKRGQVSEQQQVRIAKLSTLAVGALAVGFGLLAQGFNVGVLVILAIAVAASANFPVIVLSLFWRRFNTAGVIGGVAVGLVSSLVLAFIGPAFMKGDAIFPILNPTILSMPLGFLGAVLGTLIGGRDRTNEARFSEVLFQAQTGRGVGQ